MLVSVFIVIRLFFDGPVDTWPVLYCLFIVNLVPWVLLVGPRNVRNYLYLEMEALYKYKLLKIKRGKCCVYEILFKKETLCNCRETKYCFESQNMANAVSNHEFNNFVDDIMFKNAYCEMDVKVGISIWLMSSPMDASDYARIKI